MIRLASLRRNTRTRLVLRTPLSSRLRHAGYRILDAICRPALARLDDDQYFACRTHFDVVRCALTGRLPKPSAAA